MIYPKFLKTGDTIGICAPSHGIVKDEKRIYFGKSLENIQKEGYLVKETASVRTDNGLASNTPEIRGKEFNELIADDETDFIWCAAGGDFMVQMLDFVEDDLLRQNPKWFYGYSDPTSLLFHITTNLDIATLYGNNAGSFDMQNLHPSLKNALEIVKGNMVKQESFTLCEENVKTNAGTEWIEDGLSPEEKIERGYALKEKDFWKTPNGPVNIEGRLIGGCIDCLNFIIGTKYDGTKKFIQKYQEDGIIWYFDNYGLRAEDLYFALWHMKHSGWFENAKGFVFGRTLFEGSMLDLSYEEAVKMALGDEVPVIMEADIGHVAPKFTLINGAIGHFEAQEGRGSLEMRLE
ncbi:MAG: LD-carboxypeptidase [Clostridia bacterium]|nr:LD-carboxypeptidase [Clostridia bacterium]